MPTLTLGAPGTTGGWQGSTFTASFGTRAARTGDSAGARWASVAIPQGATITSATLAFTTAGGTTYAGLTPAVGVHQVDNAPALANANVGVAMGAAGSDVALETADVALMADDLSHLPFAVGLSRQTTRIIQQNLWVSLGVVAALIPSTIFGLQIGAAIIFHEGSTLIVVANALRLLAYRESAT